MKISWLTSCVHCSVLYELSLEWPCCLILLVYLECRQAGLCSVGWYFQRLPQSCHTAALCSKTVPLFTRPNSLPFKPVLTLWIMLFLSLLVLSSDRLMHVHCSFSWYAWHFMEHMRLGSKRSLSLSQTVEDSMWYSAFSLLLYNNQVITTVGKKDYSEMQATLSCITGVVKKKWFEVI